VSHGYGAPITLLFIQYAYNDRTQEESQSTTSDTKGHLQTQRLSKPISPSPTPTRLNSWKEIAAFFDKDVRTLRRWEVERKMPVHRVPGGPRSGVYAYVNELERWLRSDEEATQEHQTKEQPETQLTETTVHREPQGSYPVDHPQPESVIVASPSKSTLWKSRRPKFALGLAICLAIVWLVRASVHSPRQPKSSSSSGAGLTGRSAEVQDLYLRGRYFLNLRTEQGIKQALELFSTAAEQDPHFAAAYAGIADSYILIRQYGHMPDSEAFPRALEASQKALALDANSFEAHRSYAFILNYWLWNFHDAEKEFLRVIAIHPDDALAHHWYATSLYSAGRFRDALEQIEIARQLQPESIAILANRDLLLAEIDRKSAFNDLIQLAKANPSFPPIHSYLAQIYFSNGETKQYLDESIVAASLSGDTQRSEILQSARSELTSRGSRNTLNRIAEGFGNLADKDFPDAMTPAFLYVHLGEKERSLHYLALACHRHESTFLRIGYDKSFEPLIAEGAFQELLRRRNTPIDRDRFPAAPKC
jgi:tetratricopeptide (TPR) repeat protein